MKLGLKGASFAISIALAGAFPGQASAGFPTIDSLKFGSEIAAAYTKYKKMLEKNEYFMQAKELAGELSKSEISTWYNGVSNAVGRSGAAKQELANIKTAEQQQAIPFLCSNISYSLNLDTFGCDQEDQSINETQEFLNTSSVFSSDPTLASNKALELSYEVMSRNPDLFFQDPTYISQFEEKSSIFDVSLLFSPESANISLNSDQHDAVRAMIQIVTPSYDNYTTFDDISASANQDRLRLISRELPMIAARQSLLSALQIRSQREDGSPSTLATYQEIIDTFSSPTAALTIGSGNTSTPYTLKRAQLIIQLHKARVQFDKFKSSLRTESLEALKLVQQLN